jgi:hypothetical protein
MRWKLIGWLGLCCLAQDAFAQQRINLQLWQDCVVDRPFGKRNQFLFETEFSYQTVLTSDNKWRSFNATPDIEWSVFRRLDLIGALAIAYTQQNDTTNTFELRPIAGARWYFTPGWRIETRMLIRFEYRNNYVIDTKQWESEGRTRIRAEFLVPINKKRYSADHMAYALADGELFFPFKNEVSERYSNRFRARIGLGYRLNYNWRAEAIYTLQRSRNEIGDSFGTVDNILRLRLKIFLPLKHKDTKKNDTGSTTVGGAGT